MTFQLLHSPFLLSSLYQGFTIFQQLCLFGGGRVGFFFWGCIVFVFFSLMCHMNSINMVQIYIWPFRMQVHRQVDSDYQNLSNYSNYISVFVFLLLLWQFNGKGTKPSYEIITDDNCYSTEPATLSPFAFCKLIKYHHNLEIICTEFDCGFLKSVTEL